jgi:hypothetical protein
MDSLLACPVGTETIPYHWVRDAGAASSPQATGLSWTAPNEVTSVTIGWLAAEKADITSSVAHVPVGEPTAECRTTEVPCLVCVTTLSLDDEQTKTGTIRWKVTANLRLKMGIAVSFESPRGHSSPADPELLKAFPPRRFW